MDSHQRLRKSYRRYKLLRSIYSALYYRQLGDYFSEVCRRYWDSGRAAAWMLPGLRLKTRIRCAGYRLFRADLNKIYHRILGR